MSLCLRDREGAGAPSREGSVGLSLCDVCFRVGCVHWARPCSPHRPPACRAAGRKGNMLLSGEEWTERPWYWRHAPSIPRHPGFSAVRGPVDGALGRRKATAVELVTPAGGIRCRKHFVQEVAVQALKSPAPLGFSLALSLWEDAAPVLFPLTVAALAGRESGRQGKWEIP